MRAPARYPWPSSEPCRAFPSFERWRVDRHPWRIADRQAWSGSCAGTFRTVEGFIAASETFGKWNWEIKGKLYIKLRPEREKYKICEVNRRARKRNAPLSDRWSIAMTPCPTESRPSPRRRPDSLYFQVLWWGSR